MPQAKILPSFELYSEEQKAVIARIGPQFRDAADRHARAHLRREAGVQVASLCPADSTYSIPAWSEVGLRTVLLYCITHLICRVLATTSKIISNRRPVVHPQPKK